MFPEKISQNVDIFARIHGNVFPRQPAIMGNKASFYQSIYQISLPWLHLFFHNACRRYLKFRGNLLYNKHYTLDRDKQLLPVFLIFPLALVQLFYSAFCLHLHRSVECRWAKSPIPCPLPQFQNLGLGRCLDPKSSLMESSTS